MSGIPHPDAFGVVAAAAERALAAGADPFVSTLVPPLLFGHALGECAHDLLPSAQRLDLFHFLGGEHSFQGVLHPAFGNIRGGQGEELFRPLEIVGEGLVERIEKAFVLHQGGAGQMIELVYVRIDHAGLHGVQEAQEFLGGHWHARVAQVIEKFDEHLAVALVRV